MPGLREKVEGLDSGDFVVLLQLFQVPDLGGRIATHIDNSPGAEVDELGEKFGAASFAGRIDHNGGL